ncbi:MAG: TonB-dependent receptor [Tannerella sp.]|jgi:TonB-linked SusC/RagA family outer membrane protein|nr:TonB-dependent receptor [Tannerella sp.]
MKKNVVFYGKMPVVVLLMFLSSFVMMSYAAEKVESAGITTPAQSGKTITCLVQDDLGPVAGANVSIKGTTTGDISDMDGKVTLQNVPTGSIVVVSFIGYIKKEIQVGEADFYEILLQEDTQRLEEVVVVGYGTQKKVNLTGALSTINVGELTESRPVTNISNALAGLAAGVSVTSANNRPGHDDASIVIRGPGSINESSPLVIIDGTEAGINTVNPQDIETMTILKDAASAAIYGSRAAGGVILITTKQGKSGALRLNYNGYVSFESIRNTLNPVSNYADYMEYMNEGFRNSGEVEKFSQDMIQAWRNGNDPLLYPNTNWIKETFNSSVATNHNVSVSGGSENVRIYSSFGYLNNPGVMDNSGQEKYSARINMDADVRSWLKVGANLNGYFQKLDVGTDNIGDVFTYTSATTPGMVFHAPDGRYGAMNNIEDDPQAGSNNPIRRLNSINGNYQKHNVRARFYGTVTPFQGFSVTASYNYDFTDDQREATPVFLDGWNFLTNTVSVVGTGRSWVGRRNEKVKRNFGDIVANYNSRFVNERLSLAVMAGISQEQYLWKYFQTQRYDLVDVSLGAVDAATGDATAAGYSTEWAMRSFFGRINIGWDDKYLFEANLRGDASSRFQKKKRWGYFPSFSAAWRISEEGFLKDSFFDNLKLRLSYGALGNNSLGSNKDRDGNYSSQPLFRTSNYVWGNALAVGMAQTALSNANLTWETTYKGNIGLDFGMLRGRLNGSIDVFNDKTVDILIDLPAPNVHGNSSIPRQNSATVTNKGFDIDLGWNDRAGDFSYGIKGNFSYVRNKVTKFKGEDYSLSGANYIREGYAIRSQYLLRVDRIIQTDEDLKIVQGMLAKDPKAFAAFGTPQKGDLLYKDLNGDGIIDNRDKEVVSDGNNPKYLFSLNPSFAYKGFDISVLLQGQAGIKVYWQTAAYNTPTVRYGYQLNKDVIKGRWTEGRTDATYPRLLVSTDSRNTQVSDFYLENKAYLKIKNIQLGYEFPKSITNKLFMERLRIYGTLENFFTFTKYRGLDPEVNGVQYPTIKQAVVGLNLSF